jgi:2-polyprenyl-3-methyl-5-hydroxy-6-metoxy-1,4-benzoquinol methylase
MICHEGSQKPYLNLPLRSGPWGKWTKKEHQILECSSCKGQSIDDYQEIHLDYQSDDYINQYRAEKKKPHTNRTMADNADQVFFSASIPRHYYQDKVVMDIGAGCGQVLKLLAPYIKQPIAIEPSESMRAQLPIPYAQYPYLSDFLETKKSVEFAYSINVIEHIPDIQSFLDQIKLSLSAEGKVFILTPNKNDLLKFIAPRPFKKYFFRTAHPHYLCSKSLTAALESAGFKIDNIQYIHRYGPENLLFWLLNRRPGNWSRFLLPKWATGAYRFLINTLGLSSHFAITASKKS